jgi:hypothetical protein
MRPSVSSLSIEEARNKNYDKTKLSLEILRCEGFTRLSARASHAGMKRRRRKTRNPFNCQAWRDYIARRIAEDIRQGATLH